MIKGNVLTGGKRGGVTSPTISIKKHGRAIINRAMADFLKEFDRVVFYWEASGRVLTVQGIREGDENEEESLKIQKGDRSNTTGGFSVKQKLNILNWDWSENRGPFVGEYLPEDRAVEFKLPAECFTTGVKPEANEA
jgi:hypothetical protein